MVLTTLNSLTALSLEKAPVTQPLSQSISHIHTKIVDYIFAKIEYKPGLFASTGKLWVHTKLWSLSITTLEVVERSQMLHG